MAIQGALNDAETRDGGDDRCRGDLGWRNCRDRRCCVNNDNDEDDEEEQVTAEEEAAIIPTDDPETLEINYQKLMRIAFHFCTNGIYSTCPLIHFSLISKLPNYISDNV